VIPKAYQAYMRSRRRAIADDITMAHVSVSRFVQRAGALPPRIGVAEVALGIASPGRHAVGLDDRAGSG
jgi:hypothetical protein